MRARGAWLPYMVVIAAAVYVLAPAAWEPGAESLKNWVSARICRQTGGFPVFDHGPLYNIYLQAFLSFDYPLSIQLEHLVTHLFTYTALFLLLARFLPRVPALMLVCAWIPALWTMEGGNRVIGMGCLALYLEAGADSTWSGGLVPVTLLAATLFDLFFVPFILGHVVGALAVRWQRGERLWPELSRPSAWTPAPALARVALAAIVIVTLAFPSHRPDHNSRGMEEPWAPVPLDNVLALSSVQAANWHYAIGHYPKAEWIHQDWYLTQREAFGGATTLLGTIRNNPRVYLTNVFFEALAFLRAPSQFLTGFRPLPSPWHRVLLPAILVVLAMCGYWIARGYRQAGQVERVFSLGAGVAAGAVAISLVYVSQRYMMPFLPIGLLAAAHAGHSLRALGLMLRSAFPRTGAVPAGANDRTGGAGLIAAGILLLALPLAVNPWLLGDVLGLPSNERMFLIVFDLVSAAGGVAVLARPGVFVRLSSTLDAIPYPARASRLTLAAVAGIALLVVTATTPYSWTGRAGFLTRNPYALRGPLSRASGPLMASLGRGRRVLALEESWIRSFANVDTETVYHPLYLPPFKDASGKTERFLEGLDVIWVSDSFATPAPSAGTQTYLRDELHVEPFLRRAVQNGWTREDVAGFGRIYRKKASLSAS